MVSSWWHCLRLLDTKLASIRVSWQIWDSDSGTIAWEGTDEISYANDTGRERPVSFGSWWARRRLT
jgi:hypothetical protein